MAAKSTPKQRRPNDRTRGEYNILIGRMGAEVIAQKIEKLTADPARNPGGWLYQLGVVLKRLADEVGTIASFRADQKYANAKRLDAGEPPDPQDLADLRRVKLKTLHGKTGEERQVILDRWKTFESRQTTGPEYLRATCVVMLENWPVAIYGARRLLRKIHDEGAIVFNEPAFLPARESIQEALACLVTIVDEGLSVLDDWKPVCRVTEFDDDDAVAELFLHAGAFAERLREHNIQRRLEAEADRIRACSLTLAPQLAEDETNATPTLTEHEAEVLNYLHAEFPQVRYQSDIAAAIHRDRNTVSSLLHTLMQGGCGSRPKGKSKGYVITSYGQEYMERHFA